MNESEKRVVVITGASRGIGRSILLSAITQNYNIAYCYQRQSDAAEKLKQEISDSSASIISEQINIADEPSVERFLGSVNECYGRIDVLINNAGCTADGLLATMPLEDIMSVINTNIIGTMLMCKHALRYMIPQRQGNIVNISSISASKPNRGQTNYAASKGAVEALTRALAVEVASKGILVNCVAPGVIKTDMAGTLISQHEAQIKSRLLTKSLGVPDDITRAVFFLASEENKYINGQILHVDGGIALG